MFRGRTRFAIVLAVISLLPASSEVFGETWHLENSGFRIQDSEFLLAVAEIKKLVNAGECVAARRQMEQLKGAFPEIAGPDLDAFIEAEILFCQGKFVKAARRYDGFLAEYPESALLQAALDRQFAIATAFLAGRKRPVLGVFKIKGYAEGAGIMERLSDRAGDAPIAIDAAVAMAKSLERRGKFNEAYYKWSEISSRWPTGPIARDALLAMAQCKHAAYKGPEYDGSSLISAKSYYENFRLRYPKDAEKIGVDEKLKRINEQLAYKQFSIGRYYQRTANRQPANLYYQMVLDNWPDSSAAKMAEKMISRNLGSDKIKK